MTIDPTGRAMRFSVLLRAHRQRRGLSQHALARAAGVDPAYINRMESPTHARAALPSAGVLERLTSALTLDQDEQDDLYLAAGKCPPTLAKLANWDPLVGQLADRLAALGAESGERKELALVVRTILRHWNRAVD